MARGRQTYKFSRFARGLNTADGVFGLREGYEDDPQGLGSEARALMNVVSRHRGNVSKRDGSIQFATNGSVTYKDFSVIGSEASSFAVLSTTGGALYAVSAAGTATSLVASGLSASAKWIFLRHPVSGSSGPAFGMNGTDTPRETDGTGAGTGNWTATTGTVPNGTIMEYHANTLWVAGVAATPYSLFWNLVGDPLNWPAANVTKFNPDDGQAITALRSIDSYLLVFKERGIWRVYNEETSANAKFADNVGTRSPRSVVASPVGCFFLDSQRGVHVTDGNTVTPISAQIQPTLDAITDSDLPEVTGAYWQGHYYMSAKVSGVRYVFDYDTELHSWWIHSPTMFALNVWDQGSDVQLFGVPDASGGAIWQMFKSGELRDNGTIFESYWSGPFHAFGTPHLRKRCNELHVDARGKANIYVATDYDASFGSLEANASFSAADTAFGGSGTFGGLAGTFGGGGAVGEDWLYSLGVGRSWSLTFYSAAEDAWEMDAYTMLMTARRD